MNATTTAKELAAMLRSQSLLALTPRRKALDKHYGYSDLFDQSRHLDFWLLHRAVRQSALSGRLNASVFLALQDMTAYRYADLLANLYIRKGEWLSPDCCINMDDVARFLNRNGVKY